MKKVIKVVEKAREGYRQLLHVQNGRHKLYRQAGEKARSRDKMLLVRGGVVCIVKGAAEKAK